MTEEELAQIQTMVTAAAQIVEDKLGGTLTQVVESINSKISVNEKAFDDLQVKAKTAFESLPTVIHTQVENQLAVLTKQFEERQKEPGANAGGGNSGGALVDKLLANSDKLIGMWTAYKQPTTEAAMMGQMNLIFRWHGLLSKLEKGGGTGDDITKAIADTFNKEE